MDHSQPGSSVHEIILQADSLPTQPPGKPVKVVSLQSYSMDMSLSKLRDILKDREAWRAAVHGITRVGQDLATEQQQPYYYEVKMKQYVYGVYNVYV